MGGRYPFDAYPGLLLKDIQSDAVELRVIFLQSTC